MYCVTPNVRLTPLICLNYLVANALTENLNGNTGNIPKRGRGGYDNVRLGKERRKRQRLAEEALSNNKEDAVHKFERELRARNTDHARDNGRLISMIYELIVIAFILLLGLACVNFFLSYYCLNIGQFDSRPFKKIASSSTDTSTAATPTPTWSSFISNTYYSIKAAFHSRFKFQEPPENNRSRHQLPATHQPPTADEDKLHWFNNTDKNANADRIDDSDVVDIGGFRIDDNDEDEADRKVTNTAGKKGKDKENMNSDRKEGDGWYDRNTPVVNYLRLFYHQLKEEVANKKGDLYNKLLNGEIEFPPPPPTATMVRDVKKGHCPKPDPFYYPTIIVSLRVTKRKVS